MRAAAVVLLASGAAAQGGCCCSNEWSANGTTFQPGPDGTPGEKDGGRLLFQYSLDESATRVDWYDSAGALTRQWWSLAGGSSPAAYDYNPRTGSCGKTALPDPTDGGGFIQLCWDASNPFWHLVQENGTCAGCTHTIQWLFRPQNSSWVTGHPCNALRSWGRYQSLKWLGADYGPITASVSAGAFKLPSACM